MTSSGTSAPAASGLGPRLATALVFGTSFCVLVLEILAGRLLAPVIGVSLETFTGIIGTVLAGIALGSAAGGRLADTRDPMPLLGPTLVLGGVLSWLSPVLAATLDPQPAADPLTIIGVTAVLFFAPATVLSAVSPMVAKLQIQDLGRSGTVVGNLSAAGTAGALAGTFLTGFVFVAALGTRTLIVVVGAALVAAGVALTGWARVRRQPLAVVAALALAAAALGMPDRCDTETAYACVEVVADPDRSQGRVVVLNGTRNSYVDLADATHLEFRYMRLFAQALDSTVEGPVDALYVGGAGLTFPRYLAVTRPGTSHVILEIDGELTDHVVAELGPVPGDRVDVRTGDARLTLAAVPDDSVDLIVADAFSGFTVPWHLTTTQFAADLDRVLGPDGLVLVNLVDGGTVDFARAQVATYRHHFEHVVLIEPPGGLDGSGQGRNLIVVAADRPLTSLTVEPSDGLLVDADRLDRLLDGVGVLDDDFAPVDQLRRVR